MTTKRIKITIEIEVPTGLGKSEFNKIALAAMDATVTRNSNPVFLSTENVDNQTVIRNLR